MTDRGAEPAEAIQPAEAAEAAELQRAIRRVLGRSLHVRHLDAGSCNGCDWEIAALLNPYHAADRGYVDAVIRPSQTRVQITRALRLLRTKRATMPPKKHGNIPL